MNKWVIGLLISTLALFGSIDSVDAALGKSVARSATKSATKRVMRKISQKLGPLYRLRKSRTFIRWSKRPRMDMKEGIPTRRHGTPHIFTQRVKLGRKPSPANAQRDLNIGHRVSNWERIRVSPGTRYHVRTVKGGKPNEKEFILHGEIQKSSITCGNCARK